ncbi:hypothetical protein P7L74_00790 (plasmid) [Tistrella mobilis]|uniref:hypothetical protein n=1 Tax=Tistrella mobilis TaxID=171437 RepID=UPI003556DAFE
MSPQFRQPTDHHHDNGELPIRRTWQKPALSVDALSGTAVSSSGAFDGSSFS